jgi:predicted nuclease of predicted toxin-antitoxin system
MKLLADENIPASVVRLLEEDGYDIRWIRIESPGISDIEVMRYAHQEKRIILTYDKDFGELAVKDPIYPSFGIILIRFSQKNPDLMAEYIRHVVKSRQDWEGHFSVIEVERIRMRPLPH